MLHILVELGADIVVVSVEGLARLSDEFVVLGLGDFSDTRGGASFEVVEEAGSGSVIEDIIGAAAKQEGAFQSGEGVSDGADVGEGSEVVSLYILGSAVS